MYYYADALGSTRLMTDKNGHAVFSDGYQPFGNDNGTPTGSETYKFTGKPVSTTIGVYFHVARLLPPFNRTLHLAELIPVAFEARRSAV